MYVGPLLLRVGAKDGAGGAHWPLQEEVAVRARHEGIGGGPENGGRRINDLKKYSVGFFICAKIQKVRL